MLRMVLADDDELLLDTLAPLLRGDGYDVTVAHNGREALDAVHRGQQDVLVLDLLMPVEDGRTVCRAIAQERAAGSHWARCLSVIVITAQSNPGVVEGADLILKKPIEVKALEAAMAKLTGGLSL